MLKIELSQAGNGQHIIKITSSRKKYYLFGKDVKIIKRYIGRGCEFTRYPMGKRFTLFEKIEIANQLLKEK